MKLTIDNLDGNGAIDYSGALSATQPIRIERKLNEPSICSFVLVTSGTTLIAPLRNGRVIVTDNNGIVLFTGYLITEPARELAGAGTTGAVYRLSASAVSDEVLLDWQTVPQTRATVGQTVGATAFHPNFAGRCHAPGGARQRGDLSGGLLHARSRSELVAECG